MFKTFETDIAETDVANSSVAGFVVSLVASLSLFALIGVKRIQGLPDKLSALAFMMKRYSRYAGSRDHWITLALQISALMLIFLIDPMDQLWPVFLGTSISLLVLPCLVIGGDVATRHARKVISVIQPLIFSILTTKPTLPVSVSPDFIDRPPICS